MTKTIKIRMANPAGNTTSFVLDRCERSDYASVAKSILSKDELGAEQVAFVTGENSMEMCGQEFCGNASRAFALMCARSQGLGDAEGELVIPVKVSGADAEIKARVRPRDNYVEIDMPLPKSTSKFEEEGVSGILVDLGGIMHLVLQDVLADDELFNRIRKNISDEYDPPAIGVMFINGGLITPIVYVKDVESVYHEGSCASGATAIAIAESAGMPDGEYSHKAVMPEGSLDVKVHVDGGAVARVSIGSTIELEEVCYREFFQNEE